MSQEYNKKELFDLIDLVPFPESHYYHEVTQKSQIYLHHTVSPGTSASGDINHWLSTTARVATHVIITQDGRIHQCFSSKYWGHHLGIKTSIFNQYGEPGVHYSNKLLNRNSLSIEIDSLGPVNSDGTSIAYGPSLRETAGIQEYVNKFRGYQYYERYTEAQIETVRQLLLYWTEQYDIPRVHRPEMWDMSKLALRGESGIWAHVSVRPDKSDIHPQPELVEMLKSLQ